MEKQQNEVQVASVQRGFDVAQIVAERLEFLEQKAEDEKIPYAERCEAVFETLAIKREIKSLRF